MSKKTVQQTTTEPETNQTPFEQFKTALSTVLSVPKSSLPKSPKTSRKK